jgi:gamma-glutamylcyclotransferase (GGCT)/AIG2-like uncharacterized protein YtfP
VPAARIFVYGTLLSGFTNPHARLLQANGVLAGIGRVRGRLYNLGRYPAIRLGGEGWVRGELYELPPPVLGTLDAYEGDEYKRVMAVVALDSGRRVRSWVYEYLKSLPEWRRILSGDYRSI